VSLVSGEVEPQPLILVLEDLLFHRVWLSQIVQDADCELIKDVELETLDRRPGGSDLDLIIAPVRASTAVRQVEQLRADPLLRNAPILGITTLDRSSLAIDELRGLGVVGLVNKRAIPELITHRINELVRDYTQCRRFARAPTFHPVDVTLAGEVLTEYALNLSAGGMLITASQPIEPGQEVTIRFQLPAVSSEWLEATGSVVYRRRGRNSVAVYELGVHFPAPRAEVQRLLDLEVRRLLEDDLLRD
jgi:hypothetical protein